MLQGLRYHFFKKQVTQRLQDQYKQNWHSELNSNALFYNYRMFKQDFQFENYLNLLPQTLANTFLKFRLLNHKLPIQKGRFLAIERNDRVCSKCELQDLGDEFHCIFVCPFFADTRRQCLKPYYRQHPNALKFNSLFNSKNCSTLKNLVVFLKIIIQAFR